MGITVAPEYSGIHFVLANMGEPPAALAHYTENTVKRAPEGQSVAFSFNAFLSDREVAETLDFCTSAFNAFGYKIDDEAQVRLHRPEGKNETKVTLLIPDASIPQTQVVVDIRQVDFEKREVVENRDILGASWYALRAIRLASNHLKATAPAVA